MECVHLEVESFGLIDNLGIRNATYIHRIGRHEFQNRLR